MRTETNTEIEARTINAEPWDPPPGMEKRRCPRCDYFFAAKIGSAEPRCPDCVALGRRRANQL
ncbi:MAG: hypothetical protein FWD12_00910 [Alphaproteobacteria bacterium]|nr:hypothetical protein [Alphaproteobacteria bacterium]